MPIPIAHFAINANDIERARKFYGNVFQWKFAAYGPPGFFLIDSSNAHEGPPMRAALQGRREIVPGVAMRGFECTIPVKDIQSTAKAIETNGGKVVMQPVTLAGIGRLLWFEDTEGNLAGAMQYDTSAD